jgi:hypothetical protein
LSFITDPRKMKKYRLILFFALLKVLIHFLTLHPSWELHRDEMLYIEQGRHLDWGFLEVPPLLPFLSHLTQLIGDKEWMYRAWMWLMGGLTVFYTGKMVIKLGGGAFAQTLACMGVICSGFLRINLLYQQNAVDVFIWTLISYLILCYLQNSEKRYLLGIGVCLGLGILNKYSIGFLILGLLVGLLFSEQRKLFKEPYFYVSLLITLVIAAPNLWWQYQHNIPLLHHFGELYDTQLKFDGPLDFIKGQFLFFIAVTATWVSGLYYLLIVPSAKQYRVFGFVYLGVVGGLLILHGKDYYAAAIYPVLMAFGGYWREQKIVERGLSSEYIKRILIAIIPSIAITLFALPTLAPYLSPDGLKIVAHKFKPLGVLKWYTDRKDHDIPADYADMLGWKELAMKVNKVYLGLTPLEKEKVYIHCDNYGVASAINYYGRQYGLPFAHSHSSSYLLWLADEPNIQSYLLVADEARSAEDLSHFRSVRVCDSITNPNSIEQGTHIFYLQGADSTITKMVHQQIKEKKKVFNIR